MQDLLSTTILLKLPKMLKNNVFIYSNHKGFNNTSTLSFLYYSFVRAKLDYTSIIWSPIYNICISQIAFIQRDFFKFLVF